MAKNSLIIYEGEAPILRPEVAAKLAEWKKQMQILEEQEKEIKAEILKEMVANDIRKVETPDLVITKRDKYDRESLDTAKMRKDPEGRKQYDRFVRFIEVGASVSIKLR